MTPQKRGHNPTKDERSRVLRQNVGLIPNSSDPIVYEKRLHFSSPQKHGKERSVNVELHRLSYFETTDKKTPH